MPVIRVTKEFSFEMAHTLTDYDGSCREIHGHSYKLFVTVSGRPEDDPASPKFGMVMDFGELKKSINGLIVDRYDHALVIRRADSNIAVIAALKSNFSKIEVVDYQPTCENMVSRFAASISAGLPPEVKLEEVRLHETASSYAQWLACDNQP